MDTSHHSLHNLQQQQLVYSPSGTSVAVAATATSSPSSSTAHTRKTRKPSHKATGATRSMRDVTCAPSQVLCRYANKKCSNPRAVKRTGGLHTFCAMHRENANRNQRRLDLRKRLQKQALQSSALLDRRQSLHVAQALEHVDSVVRSHRVQSPVLSQLQTLQTLHTLPLPQALPPQADHAQLTFELALPHSNDLLYEPLATPTPLRDEDVATLITLFASAEQRRQLDPLCLADVPLPREPLYDLLRGADSD